MLRKALIVITILILGLAGYASTFVVSYDRILHPPEKGRLADVARIESAAIRGVVRPRRVEELVALLKEAREQGLKVSISGSRHSQGGHILLFALVGRIFRGRIAARPRAWLALFLGGWTLFYCLYFAKMGW